MATQFSLLGTRRFLPLFVTQFLGAFNDNLYKNALVVLLTFHTAQWSTWPIEVLTNAAAGLFILPYFLFSATAGQLADQLDKAFLARLVKLLEIAIMGVAALGFLLHSLALLLGALFLLGCHSTLFGPIKYAILPQLLAEHELIGGNALVEAGTFAAILLGTLVGGLLAATPGAPTWIAAGGMAVALAGYLASRAIPSAPPPEPGLRIEANPARATWRTLAFVRQDRLLLSTVLTISWFWLYGSLFLAQFPVYAKKILGGGETLVTLMLALFTVGIAIGSLLCERFSAKRVELGLVLFGAAGLTLFGLDLACADPGPIADQPRSLSQLLKQMPIQRILVDLTCIGIFGGLFIVPLYTLMQVRSPVRHRARVIAANNILNALFMVIGAVAAAVLLTTGTTIPQLFGLAAVCNGLMIVALCLSVPTLPLRLLLWMLWADHFRRRDKNLSLFLEPGPRILVCAAEGPGELMQILARLPVQTQFLFEPEVLRTSFLGRLLGKGGTPLPIEDADTPAWRGTEAHGQMILTDYHQPFLLIVAARIPARGDDPSRACLLASRLAAQSNFPVQPLALHGSSRRAALVTGPVLMAREATPERLSRVLLEQGESGTATMHARP
ncbi:MAG: MFS transporter [Desulfobulbus sp.]|jgi:MFS family permease